MPELVSVDRVYAAQRRLEGVAHCTPLELSRAVSKSVGARTLLKCEHLQRTGSFKIRGAYNLISQLTAEERERGVVCASAGNHAQGVALSAQLAGVRAQVFMPSTAALPKVSATRAYGADVTLVDGGVGHALVAAREWARERDAVFVHPFEHPEVIAGQGTVALEILEQVPDPGTVVVPIGGGGLISGVAVAMKAVRPETRIIGVQAAEAAAIPPSLAAGRPVEVPIGDTIADGLAVQRPGELTLKHIMSLVDEVVTVADEVIARAVLLLVERAKQVVEPSGAAGLAAVLGTGVGLVEPIVVLLCGGNVDPLLLARIIQSGLVEEGRYLAFRTQVRDRPGALSRLVTILANEGANVVAVEHHRLSARLALLEVEIELAIETRGPDHSRSLVDRLIAEGYPVR